MPDLISEIDHYLKRLFPITRSLAGEGNRWTLRILKELIPLNVLEYPSGTDVYDWTLPQEWHVREAWIKDGRGTTLVDLSASNLHVVNYSEPIRRQLSLEDLLPHLHYIDQTPEAIPYRTAYYKRGWGFCISKQQLEAITSAEGPYDVFIDAEHHDGSLSIGELCLQGRRRKEYLVSTYICHPSLANDNLSGVVLTAMLARELMQRDLTYSYRFLFVPETIGAIAYCAHNEAAMKAIDCGFVVSCVGGPGRFGYKQTYDPSHELNQIIESVFDQNRLSYHCYPFDFHGSDERQYSSPGFRINMATICKDKYYEYPQYHTSLDNLSFISAENISATLDLYLQVIDRLEQNVVLQRSEPHGELMLSKHGLYPETGGAFVPDNAPTTPLDVMLSLLFYADGRQSLHGISDKSGLSLKQLNDAAEILVQKGLLTPVA